MRQEIVTAALQVSGYAGTRHLVVESLLGHDVGKRITRGDMTERATEWRPVADIVEGFGSISFSKGRGASRPLTVIMHGHRHLSLSFTRVTALRYEGECPGYDPLPRSLPMLKESVTLPLLKVEESRWADQWMMHKGLVHFALISSGDLVQLIASPTVEAQWLDTEPT
jgi:hypothetical protein